MMGKTFFGLTAIVAAWTVLVCPSPFPASGGRFGVPAAWAEKELTFHDDEIMFHFSQEKNMAHFNMLIGMLADLEREHARIFAAKGAGEDAISPKAEEFLNDANLSASQGNYEEAYTSLKSAYDLIKNSLTQMGIKSER